VQAFTHLCVATTGVIFFSGVGKSGFVAQKTAQTLVSTGTKAVFLSPTDALHGDIGLVGPDDVVVLLSKSGATEELNKLVPCARAKGAYLVGISSLKNSNFREMCDMHVYLPLERELCPFDLAPVTSTAIQMLFGDTVAIALMQAKNLTREQYALNHPGGRTGKRLIFRVYPPMASLQFNSTRFGFLHSSRWASCLTVISIPYTACFLFELFRTLTLLARGALFGLTTPSSSWSLVYKIK